MRAILPFILASTVLAQEAILPKGADGKPLNLGFESGKLDGWKATGDAFGKQPVKGDTVKTRRDDMASEHAGSYWIGTYEMGAGDDATGTLTSDPFKVDQPWASFLVGGGDWPETRVELVSKSTGKPIFTARGAQNENLRRAVVDLGKMQGQEIFIRIVDEKKGHWGHINFDDFVFHASEPKFAPQKIAAKPAPALVSDVVAHAGLKPEEVPGAATVPPGYELKVFAAEPDIINPISFALDDRGRAWVVEGLTYPVRAKDGVGKDRVIVFEDTDGDHRFDKRTVFIEGLNLVSGIEVGFGGVWIGAAPTLSFIPVTDWDNPKPAGEARVVLDGWGYQDTHETLNTFHWGPDGWLYGCHGVFTHSKVGKPGAPDDQRVKINAGIWRYHPQQEKFEVFSEGTSNPWGIDWNDQGELFAEACVIPHFFHLIRGGRYQRQAGEHFNHFTYQDIQTIADHRHYLGATPHAGNSKSDAAGGGHAHAGLCILQHPSWPENLKGGVLMGNIHGQRINMDILKPSGSGYIGSHGADFINFNDRASQIVDIREDHDGAVWMIDWYDINQCHNPNPKAHDYTTGRIYKLVKQGAKATKINLSSLGNAELGTMALNGVEFDARNARRILQERTFGAGELAALRKIVTDAGALTPRSVLLWNVIASKEDGGGTFPVAALNGASPAAASWLIRLVSQEPKVSADWCKEMASQAQHATSPVVRLALASAAQRLTIDQRKPIVSALLGHGEDADDHNLPLMYWYATEPVVGADPAWAAEALGSCKLSKIQEFIARRLAGTK